MYVKFRGSPRVAAGFVLWSVAILFLSEAKSTQEENRVVNQWIHCTGVNTSCPTACVCQPSYVAEGTEVYCNGVANMTDLLRMAIPANTVSMHIINSTLTHLPPNCISNCSQLHVLSIYNSSLRTLDKDAFAALAPLRNLSMNSNNLTWSVNSLPDNLFDPLVELVDLQLMFLSPTNETTEGYRVDLFQALGNLRSLYLDGLPRTDFGEGFARLANLQLLYINGGLSVVKESTFMAFRNTSLKTLEIFARELSHADESSLVHFSSLRTLSVSFSMLSMDTFFRLLLQLSDTNRVLEEVTLMGDATRHSPSLVVINETFLTLLGRFSLRKLAIPAMQLSLVAPGISKLLPHLQYLDLSDNRIDVYFTGLLGELLQLQNLTILSVCCQHVASIWRDQFGDDNGSAGKLPTTIVLPPKLQKLDLAGTCQNAYLPPLTFLGAPKLTYFSLAQNGILHMQGPLSFPDVPPGQLNLNMVSNKAKLDLNVFGALEGVQSLYMTGNNLNMLKSDNQGQFFYNATFLTRLVLGNCELSTLPLGVLRNQRRLKELTLHNNYLTTLDFDLKHMKDLENLDLRYNQLTALNEKIRLSLDEIKLGRRHLSVNLDNNPILCSCETLHFVQWLIVTNVSVTVPSTCLFGDQRLPLDVLSLKHRTIPQLELHCGSHDILVAAIVSLSCSVLLILLSVCVYRQRWNIKFFCLKFVRDRKRFMEGQASQMYEFDAFIAYHKDDLPWVREQLVPRLEREDSEDEFGGRGGAPADRGITRGRDFSFCIHHRDFMPGMPIEENIIDALTKSTKVLLVISRTFATSSWCEFEMQLARIRSIDEGRDVIIPVLMEHLPTECMSHTLVNLLNRNTYIEWPASSAERRRFWDKLRAALRTRHPADVHFIHCDCGKTIQI